MPEAIPIIAQIEQVFLARPLPVGALVVIFLAIVVLGGMGNQLGSVLAAIFLIGMTEFFRDLEQFRMLAFGAGMVAIMVWRPRGLLAHRDPTIRLNDGKGGDP